MIGPALSNLPVWALLLLAVGLVLSGFIKGLLGVGLPLTAVPILTFVVDVPTAVAILTIPLVATNAMQSFRGGSIVASTRELAPIIIPLILGIFIGVRLTTLLSPPFIIGLTGWTLLVGVCILAVAPASGIRTGFTAWISPVVGLISGIMGGIAAMYGPPLMSYMIARNCPPDQFIKKISILYTVASVGVLLAFGSLGAMTIEDLLLSSGAMIVVSAGLAIGTVAGKHVNAGLFRVAVLLIVAVSALQMIAKAFGLKLL